MRCRITFENGYYIGEVYGTWAISKLGFQDTYKYKEEFDL